MNLSKLANIKGSAGHIDAAKPAAITHNANSSATIFEDAAVANANSSGRIMATNDPSGNGCSIYSATDLLASSGF